MDGGQIIMATVLTLAVVRKAEVAQDIMLFEFRAPDGAYLPPFAAGAHLLVRTPAGLPRRYSLCNAPSERHRYVIAVKREAAGAGGSVSMADRLAVGDILETSLPENYFPLSALATTHVLIAGGIGITPILAMARHLREIGASFRLIYCARAKEFAAFGDELADGDFAGRLLMHFDGGDTARALNFSEVLSARPAGAHVYCCGPRMFMQVVREAARRWPAETVHFEDFGTALPSDSGAEREFRVRLARSGKVLSVPAGVSILEILRHHGAQVASSCEAGTCGACRMRLLAGTAEHRDFVLDEDEQENAIMICVSRAISEELTLDV
jgi:phthalate 4,5-dioxygenase reductase component